MDGKRGLGTVSLPVTNLGTEVWLVSNPEETLAAFEDYDGGDDDSPLDAAARVARDCTVLAAHWGDDVPRERDEAWLAELLAATRDEDRDEVRDLVEREWKG